MKHACYQHIGYILEQEGDSFTLAFHEPQDAVAFTLQVSLRHALFAGFQVHFGWQ